MEKVPEIFDFEKSPIKEAYVLLGATTPLELSRRYTEEEQVLFKNYTWDYDNPEQIQNRIKEILESVPEAELSPEEADWRNEILWFWYHHAISVSMWKKDREKAKFFSEKALEYQDNGNILTKLLYLLCRDEVVEAEKWIVENENDTDVETARELLEEYKQGLLW